MKQSRGIRTSKLIAGLSFALAVFACAKESNREGSPQPENQAASAAKPDPSPDCVRGEPEPLLASRSEFRKTARGEAIETVRTDAPVQLTIRHFGCAHYALDFEFVWPAAMPEPKLSIQEAARILDALPARDAVAPVLKSLVAALRKMAEEPYKQPAQMSETETLAATTPALTTLRIRYDVAL